MDKVSTLKMYHGIFSALHANKTVSVFTSDKEYRKVFSASKQIFLALKPEEADIVLITNISTLHRILENKVIRVSDKKPILFVTNYSFLKYSEAIVGAFYWRKGRSQLLFIKKRLQKYQIRLPKAYQNFMIESL